jgi:putative aldouronate transport system substrate-binding protein
VTAGFAVCHASKHPEEALKFLELLHTDEITFNILAHGIEGKHWVFVDKEKKLIGFPSGVTGDNVGYNPAQGWMWGNQFLEYYTLPAQVGAWDKTKELNKQAVGSVALGFSLNPDPIKNELAQLSSVHSQYGLPLETGLVDPATALPEYQAKLKEAGLDKVVAEIQSQLLAWNKAKGS